ncbi:DUF4277 domain-containing protein [Nostoc sp. ChiQUE01b]|uniref:DUF4277 domain-containing protein n=1 Tax=Nostoc sp. ChiQUE01b TaxID=3075376 RepID=UPI002AD3FD9E|nr:DUF4277 domain-containing protein [Nostoc sp. ChiQUE01b]MDZ8237666.1 DUF4277 domain-containing protein [Nostoc sp. ChiQUE01a]MDZ8264334.1 DUF4277 domain-containing protein [Nostoc sp. ChiQUE01b]
MNEELEAIKVLDIDHLGIVAGIIDEMELVEEVNKKLGIKVKETLTSGQVMKAMRELKWITRVPLNIKEAQHKIWEHPSLTKTSNS